MADEEKPAEGQESGTPEKGRSSPKSPPSRPKSGASTKARSPSPRKGSAGSGRKTPKSPPSQRKSSKPGSPKARKGSPKGKQKKDTEPKEEQAEDGEKEGPPPDDIVPLFLSSKTQELFHVTVDEDVTTEEPHKLIPKEEIIQDMKMRAAISDFHPVKQTVLDYPADEILVIYDYDFKYGQNFYMALTEEAKERILHPPEEEGEGEAEPEEEIIYRYIPPEPKEWVSQGSQFEVDEEKVEEQRERVKFTISRVRREFGAPVTLSDRNAGDAKDGYIECTSYEDKSFNIKKMEKETGTQAIPTLVESGSQTEWKHPRNAATQYVPREFNEEEKEKLSTSRAVEVFITEVAPRFELALQQNEIMDVFFDDWMALSEEDSTFGSKSDNHLKEYQSFTDLQFSKEKTITSVDWHPAIKGIIAVSCAERLSFDERTENASKVLMTPSLILVWSFTDPIHPQLLLEAPDDIFCFRFNPVDPNIIAGGCINGQVVLWDITRWADRLKNNPRGKQTKKNTMMSLPGFEDENSQETPIIRYCAVSAIEHSHKTTITDLQWVPDHMEINRFGIVYENKAVNCTQILTSAVDGSVLLWETKPPKGHIIQSDSQPNNPFQIPTTFKHLDLTWKPLLRLPLARLDGGSGDYGPTRISIKERQGDRSVLDKLKSDNKTDLSSTTHLTALRTGSAKDKRQLENVSSKFYVGTEDGELVYCDWKYEKDPDSGKLGPQRPEWSKLLHDSTINTLQRSPFFKDILLCVGGWNFSIWKEGVQSGPLLVSALSQKKLTAGHWSPSRPGVFYIARSDGNVDVWDLLDRTHEPSLTQNVTAATITAIFPWAVSSKQHLLAIADNVGTLHILEVPWTLRHATSNEVTSVANYFDREVKRLEFVDERKDFRERDKRQKDADEALKQSAKPPEPDEAEIHMKMKMAYDDYEEMAKKFLEELGLIVPPEEPLPET
ncbi:dynein axonemal intermediate chain 3-like isoform X2 [Ptychodera flava]|uniref:dynein axonemal intermediate chain 3-like isoform X2 n=1 Tax=Ptychodera flava TaxID=63121 RepID=UPI00396AA378